MTTKATSFDEVPELVPTGRFLDDQTLLQTYATPERGEQGLAAFLVEPGSQKELSDVAAWAFRNRQRLVIQGANSGLVEASTPDPSGEQGILGLDHVGRLVDFNPADRVAIVEAGLRLSDLNRTLRVSGQMFPIELGSDPSMGGLAATNAGGARTIRYGDVRSRVLGLRAVLADQYGTVVGRTTTLVKDNSRLGADRMLVGSFGALGVIAQLAVRTAAIPRSVACALVAPQTHHDALDLLLALESESDLAVSAFEFISGETIDLVASTTPGFVSPLGPDRSCVILLEIESQSSDLPDLEESLASYLDQISSRNPSAVAEAVIAPASDLWALRHSLSEGVIRAGETVRFDISVPRLKLPELRDFVVGRFRGPKTAVSEFGHWGDGGTHLALVYLDGERPSDVEAIRTEIYDKVVLEFGGSFSSEHGVGRHNAAFYKRYIPASERLFESRLKALFDPRGVWGSAPFV